MLTFKHQIGIKVCGLTNESDALACAAAGVDLLGLNFSPLSPRCISPEAAQVIVAAVRSRFTECKLVGVFVNQEPAWVRATAAALALDAVQLHGDETPEDLREIGHAFTIKALRVGPGFSEDAASDYPSEAILLDTWHAHARGGTGETFPWAVAAALRPRVDRLILAGGLTPENVAEAIRAVRPFAVDVCSGVEIAPGRKDPLKIARFVAEVRHRS